MAFCPKCRYEYTAGITSCPDCGAFLVDTLPPFEPEPEQERKFVNVYTTSDVIEALRLKAFLEDAGIPCFPMGLQSGSLFPLVLAGEPRGKIELHVPADCEPEARQILEELKQTEPIAPE
ncbi:DUF2007 domain-containing protein [Candidatus Acetothermia bacterium]|nr:DUF2007 domain-containing protein [Candidatus Acetothermia bacterium]MBI3460069.1 DUF2007 domain-containing protein [Candidatus Acetothermia bacterium]MBI3659141.1 DUF2007 domain-containing protein [Candidatus Acetothermia bacterium]